MPNLTLYILEGCHYCLKVRRFMNDRGIDIPLKNVREGNNRSELIAIGGKGQVPCLVIDGKALYESDDIVAWLDQNYKK